MPFSQPVDASGLNIPVPSGTAPPPVQVDSVAGVAMPYARADHTHQSRLQARRISLTFNANGEAPYNFPLPYENGVVPIVNVTAENTAGAAFRYDVTVKSGSITNTTATLILTKTPRTITVSILGAVTSLFSNPADTLMVNIMSRAPS